MTPPARTLQFRLLLLKNVTRRDIDLPHAWTCASAPKAEVQALAKKLLNLKQVEICDHMAGPLLVDDVDLSKTYVFELDADEPEAHAVFKKYSRGVVIEVQSLQTSQDTADRSTSSAEPSRPGPLVPSLGAGAYLDTRAVAANPGTALGNTSAARQGGATLKIQREELLAGAARQPLVRQVFISHTGKDESAKTFAASILKPNLEAAGLQVYMDFSDLQPGCEWPTELVNAAANSMVVVAVLSKQYYQRYWCMLELDLALNAQRLKAGLPPGSAPLDARVPVVIPVFYDDPTLAIPAAEDSNDALARPSPMRWWAAQLEQNEDPSSSGWANWVDPGAWAANLGAMQGRFQNLRRNLAGGKDEELQLAKRVVAAAVKEVPPLVAVPKDLVGVEEEIAQLLAELGGRLGLWLSGPGGTGKSTIAKQLFNRVAERFTRTVFLELEAGDGQYTSDRLAQQLAAAVRGLGGSGTADDGVARLLPRLQDLAASHKVLYVLDNVWTAGQLDALLPTKWGKGSVVIVTSRLQEFAESRAWREVHQELHCHQLQGLKDEDSARKFRHWAWMTKAPQDLLHMEQLILDECKGLPLALLLTGGAVLDTPSMQAQQIWMIILRYFAGVMAWATLNCLMVGMTLWSYDKAGLLAGAGALGTTITAKLPATQDPAEKDRQVWAYCAYAGTAATVLLFLITLVMIRRIMVAVTTIKVASKAIAAMPAILFFPILPFIFEVGLVIYWIAVTAMLYSAGNIVPHRHAATITGLAEGECFAVYTFGEAVGIALPNSYLSVDWDDLLGWTNCSIVCVILCLSYVVMGDAVADIYWQRGDLSHMPAALVLVWSFHIMLCYHMGSIAFGAFLIAIIHFVQLVLGYIHYKTKEMKKRNQTAKWLLNCACCCMWCLEKIAKFIKRNAYTMVAVEGTGYCNSAQRAVVLIIANALRLAAVDTVRDLLIWLGKVAVAAQCCLVAYAMSGHKYHSVPEKYLDMFLASPTHPVVGTSLVGFIVAEVFFATYKITVDTIMLCFCDDCEDSEDCEDSADCEDCETNSGHPRHAPPLLLEAISERPAQSGQFQKK